MDLNTINFNAYSISGNVVLNDDMLLSGMETIIYRQYDESKVNKIVIFPMIKIGASEMNIKNINSTRDLYELLYEVEEENLKDIEYIRVNKQYTPFDMECTSATHGYENFIYHHFMIEIDSKRENSEILEIVVNAAENSNYLRGFEYIVYIKNDSLQGIREVHLLINNISLRGELLISRMDRQDDFIENIKENL